MDVIWTAEFAAQGWLLDVTDASRKRKDEFIPSTVETAEYEGKYWAIPFNTNAGFLYYRTDEVDERPRRGRTCTRRPRRATASSTRAPATRA